MKLYGNPCQCGTTQIQDPNTSIPVLAARGIAMSGKPREQHCILSSEVLAQILEFAQSVLLFKINWTTGGRQFHKRLCLGRYGWG